MPYDVWCSVDDCLFSESRIDAIDEVYDLQDEHVDRYGDHHLLEFDRAEAVAMDDDYDDD